MPLLSCSGAVARAVPAGGAGKTPVNQSTRALCSQLPFPFRFRPRPAASVAASSSQQGE